MAVTLKMIAEASGVSVQTVSKILNRNGDELYSADTCGKVREAATRLGYRLNSSARAMRTGKFDCVAFINSTDNMRSYIHLSMLDGIEEELSARGQRMVYEKMPDSKLTDEGYLPKILGEQMADGLLLNYNIAIPEAMDRMIKNNSIPAVWLNDRREADSVGFDDGAAFGRAVDYLAGLGHERIGFVQFGLSDHYSYMDRRNGYTSAMEKLGLEPNVLQVDGKYDSDPCAEWLASKNRPTAVVSTRLGENILLAALKLGMKIPDDISIVGLSAAPVKLGSVKVNTIVLPFEEMGRLGVRMLMEKIECPDKIFIPQVLSAGFADGDTCAPLK